MGGAEQVHLVDLPGARHDGGDPRGVDDGVDPAGGTGGFGQILDRVPLRDVHRVALDLVALAAQRADGRFQTWGGPVG
ncbi:hypothetical protein OOK47_59140 [Streptomyces sp. NBC_00268]|nr:MULTISPECIES: hypothetical protein [unclassified Streptomyces]MCX4410312.1 hypothetical protein [Streptomyces sp. NBC_01764]MCX5192093.1 hypothetical protein [Streptomyces sp. NBC_00268]